MKLEFFFFERERVSRDTQISNFMEIRLVGGEVLHAERQTGRETDRQTTDMTKLIVAFCNLANARKIIQCFL
jgi:hypothetical protein